MRQAYPLEFLQQIADQYNIGKIEQYHLFTSGYENTNYYIRTRSEEYVIKVFEGMGVDPENILFELRVMEHCEKSGTKTPKVFRNNQNELTTLVNGKYTMLMNFFDGENMHKQTVNNSLVKEIATESAKIDNAMTIFKDGSKTRQNYEFDIKNALLLKGSVPLLQNGIDKRMLNDILENFKNIEPKLGQLPQGLIHNDVVPHNIIQKNGKLVGVLDFSDMVFSSYAQSVAVSMHLTAFGYNWNPRQAKLFVDTYTKQHSLNGDELEILYDLILARYASFIIEFNRWNVEFGEDPQRTETIDDQYRFLQKFMSLGRPAFTKLLK